jgi:hypothetical protein
VIYNAYFGGEEAGKNMANGLSSLSLMFIFFFTKHALML